MTVIRGEAEGGGIRTFPFPAELAVGGVGMQIGPMGAERRWHADAPLHRVHRIDFHVVMLFTDGPVQHMIDFAEYRADAGDLLWIRPGQVHRFSRESVYRGTVLTMQPGFLPRATVEAAGLYRYDLPPLLHPGPAQLTALRRPSTSCAASTRTPRHSRSACTRPSCGTP